MRAVVETEEIEIEKIWKEDKMHLKEDMKDVYILNMKVIHI